MHLSSVVHDRPVLDTHDEPVVVAVSRNHVGRSSAEKCLARLICLIEPITSKELGLPGWSRGPNSRPSPIAALAAIVQIRVSHESPASGGRANAALGCWSSRLAAHHTEPASLVRAPQEQLRTRRLIKPALPEYARRPSEQITTSFTRGSLNHSLDRRTAHAAGFRKYSRRHVANHLHTATKWPG